MNGFYQIFKEKIILLQHKLFQKTEEQRLHLSSFYETDDLNTKTKEN